MMVPIDPGGEDPATPVQSPGGPAPPRSGKPTGNDLFRNIVPLQAMAYGGTLIRPGVLAWGGKARTGDPAGRRYSSCESTERALAVAAACPATFPGLLAELAVSRLWVPLPPRQRPFTDGSAVRLPLVVNLGAEFVPCFTSVQRLTAWTQAGEPAEQRAGDPRPLPVEVLPYIVVPAAGLAGLLPTGVGLALNPGSAPGLPLYPECVPYLASLATAETDPLAAAGPLATAHFFPETGDRFLIGHPPGEPSTLLAVARTALRALPSVARASRAWLSVPGAGSGLLIAIGLDDPTSAGDRAAAAEAIETAAATVPLRVPFPLDVTFPGEPSDGEPQLAAIEAWIAANTRPFYRR